MSQKVVYEGKAFVSFFTDSDNQPLELVDVSLTELEPGLYELQCSRQQQGTRVVITTPNGLSISGHVVMQDPGITRFKAR